MFCWSFSLARSLCVCRLLFGWFGITENIEDRKMMKARGKGIKIILELHIICVILDHSASTELLSLYFAVHFFPLSFTLFLIKKWRKV